MPEWKELLNAAGHQAPVSADGFRRSRTQESPHRLPAVFVTPSDSSTKSAATESQAGGRLLSESCYPIILHKADADPYRLFEIPSRRLKSFPWARSKKLLKGMLSKACKRCHIDGVEPGDRILHLRTRCAVDDEARGLQYFEKSRGKGRAERLRVAYDSGGVLHLFPLRGF